MREAAAKVAADHAGKLLERCSGDGSPTDVVRTSNAATAIEIATAIMALPAGDTLSTGGWNSDMEKAPKDEDLLLSGAGWSGVWQGRWSATRQPGEPDHIFAAYGPRWVRAAFPTEPGFKPTHWMPLPEPPPGE